MNKIRLLALIILLALIFCGCNEYKKTVIVDYAVYGSLETYNKFLSLDSFPEKFIHWNQLASLGEFYTFSFAPSGEIYEYVIDSEGTLLSLEIDHAPQPIDESTLVTEEVTNETTMYRTSFEGAVIVQRGDLNYYYENGKLAALFWYVDDIKLTITGDLEIFAEGYEPEYLERFNIPMVNLLSPDEAVANAAFAEIQEKLSK